MRRCPRRDQWDVWTQNERPHSTRTAPSLSQYRHHTATFTGCKLTEHLYGDIFYWKSFFWVHFGVWGLLNCTFDGWMYSLHSDRREAGPGGCGGMGRAGGVRVVLSGGERSF